MQFLVEEALFVRLQQHEAALIKAADDQASIAAAQAKVMRELEEMEKRGA